MTVWTFLQAFISSTYKSLKENVFVSPYPFMHSCLTEAQKDNTFVQKITDVMKMTYAPDMLMSAAKVLSINDFSNSSKEGRR